MKVLWFSPNSCSYLPVKYDKRRKGYNGGGWTTSLQQELAKREGVTLGVCFIADGQPERVEQDGVVYYPVPNHKKPFKDKLLDLIHYRDVRRDEVVWPHYIEHFKRVISDFKPDVIEVFGSELYVGLGALAAQGLPIVLHIQGLLSLAIYSFFPPGVSRMQYIWQDWNPRHAFARFQELVYWKRSCHREKTVLKAVLHVIGRTEWDRDALRVLNPEAIYHYGGEILRPEFYEPSIRQIPKRLTIVSTISRPLYKGFDLVLKTADILRNEMHVDFDWLVFGSVSLKFAEKHTGLRHEDVGVRICGVASAQKLREALLTATLYFHPSYIENSPNSVAEAQILGLPVVVTNVGGIPSMVEHGKTGFLFPSMDPYTAAYYVNEIFVHPRAFADMGERAKNSVIMRHDRELIVNQTFKVYDDVINLIGKGNVKENH